MKNIFIITYYLLAIYGLVAFMYISGVAIGAIDPNSQDILGNSIRSIIHLFIW
jgi:hypothetical protein